MEKWFSEILKDPVSFNNLEYDNGRLLNDVNEQFYPVQNNIPVFTESIKTSKVTTHLHEPLNTQFNYIDHYEKDAVFFDYSAPHISLSENVEETVLRKMIAQEIPKEAILLLDVGCGSAWFAKYFVHRKKKVVSLDVSFTNAFKAIAKVSAPNHAAVVADVYQLPFGENTFDCIVASEIIEHLHDPELFVKKMVYILKPGGKLIVTTPYNERLEYSLCIHCNRPTPRHAHLHSFNKKKIEEIFKAVPNHKFKIKIFNNGLLMKFRIHILLKNTFLWQILDNMANLIFNKALRLKVVLQK